MKKFLTYIVVIPFAAFFSVSCDILDFGPSDRYEPEKIWTNQEAFEKYATGFYAFIRDQSQVGNSSVHDAYSDIMKQNGWWLHGNHNKHLFSSNTLTTNSNGSLGSWDYGRIRRQNEFLLYVPDNAAHFGEEFIKVRMAEVRFIRAWSYFNIARVYGGVVIRTENPAVLDENGNIIREGFIDGPEQQDKPRATEEETYAFIISELYKAAADLPESWPQEWYGRATKKTAYAFLSRVALYAKEWEVAIAAADSVEKKGGALYMATPGQPRANDYADTFTHKPLSSNPEILLAVDFKDQISHGYDINFRPKGDLEQNRVIASPTAEYVDRFEYLDGTRFNWDSWQNKSVNGETPAHPWDKRDPRLDASILYHGAPWQERTIAVQAGGKDAAAEWVINNYLTTSVTGYYVRKYLSTESADSYQYNGSHQHDLILRYAEVLLNKAEAYAEANYGFFREDALAALNEVRARATMPPKTAADAPDKEAFMELLRNERIVELGIEGFRYWDLRRWRLAVEVLNGQRMHGVKVKVADGETTYERIEVDGGLDRIFQERYYLLSIPQSERNTNKLLGENNPGW